MVQTVSAPSIADGDEASPLALDIEALRGHFPALAGGVAHFDGPGGSQVPDVVADAIRTTLVAGVSNRGIQTAAERYADDVVVRARQAMADLLGADPGGIVFGRSMTQLTFDFSRALAKTWQPGDEVVVTRLDHDANIRPWLIAAESVGAVASWAEFDADSGELPVENIERLLTDRTRLVAVTGASNLIGTRPALSEIARRVHAAGALFYVDGVHLTAHAPVDMAAIGADFYACSPYKFLGPHCGVLAGRVELLEQLRIDKLLPSTDLVPERFELGTLPYELLAGTTAAVDFLTGLAGGSVGSDEDRRSRLTTAMALIERHEDVLRMTIEQGLAALPGVVLHSRARERTPTMLLSFADHDPAEAYRFLAERGINAPAGSFYALEAAQFLGLGAAGGLRVGLAPYSSQSDVDRLLAGLAEFLR
jgi:cysteine desulfurase family protein (TIGR01976 family)